MVPRRSYNSRSTARTAQPSQCENCGLAMIRLRTSGDSTALDQRNNTRKEAHGNMGQFFEPQGIGVLSRSGMPGMQAFDGICTKQEGWEANLHVFEDAE